jgi:hypothetical protein
MALAHSPAREYIVSFTQCTHDDNVEDTAQTSLHNFYTYKIYSVSKVLPSFAALIWFPDDDDHALGIKTYRNVQYDNRIQISKEQ